MSLNTKKLNFERCEDEPITTPESIQGYGYFFAIDPASGRISIVSENVKNFFNFGLQEAISRNFFDLLDQSAVGEDFIRESFEKSKKEKVRLPVNLKFRNEYLNDKSADVFNSVVFCSSDLMILEIEPADLFKFSVNAKQIGKIYSANVAPTFQELTSVEDVAHKIAQIVRDLTQFERVVIYKFNNDGSGYVVAESKVEDIDSYLHFYYPSSDIPKQAKALYLKNWIRLNPNVDIPTVPLYPAAPSRKTPVIDMTHSLLRAMSPIHVQYIKNQGLKSSMSISLINNGKLWGLISCHHREEHYVAQDIRLECESLGHLFGWQIYAKEEEIKFRKKNKTDSVIDKLIENLSYDTSIVDIFRENEKSVLDIMKASGFAFYAGREIVKIGHVPSEQLISKIKDYLVAQKQGNSFETAQLPESLRDASSSPYICGALLNTLLEEGDYFTMWFRPEFPTEIKWAGNPSDKNASGEKAQRLTPRTSFQIHKQEIRDESLAWSEDDLDNGDRFNKLFLRYALKSKLEVQNDLSQLQVRDQTKDEFLATLAHELRNPLSPITHALGIMRESTNPIHISEAYQVIDRQLHHLVRLVDDLLDVSRITRGKVRLEYEVVDLERTVKNAIEIYLPLIREKNQSLIFNTIPERLTVYGDRVRITQIFGNIIHNASKYTSPKGKIEISLSKDESQGTFEVKDNGIGIPKENISSIFDMFNQVEAGSTQTRGGLGIGLTLVRSLVELHDGTVGVESGGTDQGTTVRVSLPLYVEKQRTASPVASEGLTASSKKRVLIVEDNADVALMLKMTIELIGHEPHLIETPLQALEKFSEIDPHVALLDIGLPGIDGYELCRRLKNLDPTNKTTFVAQTGWGKSEDIVKSKKAGFDFHFVKPIQIDKLKKFFSENLNDKHH